VGEGLIQACEHLNQAIEQTIGRRSPRQQCLQLVMMRNGRLPLRTPLLPGSGFKTAAGLAQLALPQGGQ